MSAHRCTCSSCLHGDPLAQLSDAQLEQLEHDLRRFGSALKADDGWEELDLGIEADDADVMSSIWATLGAETARLDVRQKLGVEITAAELAEARLRMAAQLEIGLALLSPSAASRLAPVTGRLNELLAEGAAQARNAIQLGEELQRVLRDVGGAGVGQVYDTGVYSPFEWSRLARTELVFARTEAEKKVLQDEWGASSEAMDQLFGWPPIHPQCMCSTSVWQDADGKWWIILTTTPTACADCNDIADAIAQFVGAM